MKKVANYKLKQLSKMLKPYIKTGQKIIKFDHTEIEKYNLHQYKGSILIDNIDVNKVVVSIKISFGKNDFKYFISSKVAKTRVDIEKILIKLNLCLFWRKMKNY